MEIAWCCVAHLQQHLLRNVSMSLWHSLCLMRLVWRNLDWTQARSFPSCLPSCFGALSALPHPQTLSLVTAMSHQAFGEGQGIVLALFHVRSVRACTKSRFCPYTYMYDFLHFTEDIRKYMRKYLVAESEYHKGK